MPRAFVRNLRKNKPKKSVQSCEKQCHLSGLGFDLERSLAHLLTFIERGIKYTQVPNYNPFTSR
jgi:hypothetical protein